MKNKLETEEKVCAFYASDYHFEMITLPYVYKNIENEKDIVILTENDLKDTVSNLISKMNFKEDRKKDILNLDWKNNDLSKFRKIKENMDNNINTVVLVKGNENYIRNANKNLEKWVEQKNSLEIIDCYNIEEIGDKVDEIIGRYNKILKTSGEKNSIKN